MGVRIGKIDDGEMWVVYQSVTMAAFSPIFNDEMSAAIFARYYSKLPVPSITSVRALPEDWSSFGERRNADQIMEFVKKTYGGADDFPETSLAYDRDVMSDFTKAVEDLYLDFLEWRRNPKSEPKVRKTAQEEEISGGRTA